jgi:ATP-dependent helicase/nuclease subunit B
MLLKRYFLGWDAPLSTKVCEYLLPGELSGTVDLGNELVVVPTQQAGRRLRESMALYCEQQNTALLSVRVETSDFFLHSRKELAGEASFIEAAAVWSDVLLKADIAEYPGLFPSGVPKQDYPWALHITELLQRLRKELVDGRYSIAGVVENFAATLEELGRWKDLARLETTYLSRLEEMGNKQDPYRAMLARSETLELPQEIDRIVLAAVSDPTPLMVRALEHVAGKTTVVVLVYAPETMADCFDDWGRPIVKQWDRIHIDIPESERNVILSLTPRSQSQQVIQLITEEAGCFGPADIAIGVPDRQVIPFLEADLEEDKLISFDPAGIPLKEHPIYQLLNMFRALVSEGSYIAFSSFLRHAAVLYFLQKQHGIAADKLLEELDKFQNYYLPMDWGEIAGYFLPGRLSLNENQPEYRLLEKAVSFISEQIKASRDTEIAEALCSMLQSLYEVRILKNNEPGDGEFIAAANKVSDVLREFPGDVIMALGMDRQSLLSLLMYDLSQQQYFHERKEAVVDLEGWLELLWNDAPFMIVTGMNDGFVPGGKLSDVFLPDTLRRQLKLRSDADRLAENAYIMCALIESRRKSGRICFVVGKTSTSGDLLRPSRLLFRCDDEELPDRARRLFGKADEKRENYPPSVSFLLKASPPADVIPDRLSLKTMSATKFKDYLSCPFRFYLKYILDMEELGDDKTEMDALDFGSMMHDVLHNMTANTRMRCCYEETELVSYLCSQADVWIRRRFGASPPLQVQIQLGSARQRLIAAAHVQIGLLEQGWEVEESELWLEIKIGGVPVRGQIDRVDRNKETGAVRILDYKTADTAQSPQKAHLGTPVSDAAIYTTVNYNGKERSWRELQLPLYHMLLAGNRELPEKVEIGYFNLPKAITDTELSIWDDFNDGLLKSARACAEGIIRDVKERRFWPPSERLQYDDFEKLFPMATTATTEYVNVEDFELFMEKARGEQR